MMKLADAEAILQNLARCGKGAIDILLHGIGVADEA
jgi:hypothetical protein